MRNETRVLYERINWNQTYTLISSATCAVFRSLVAKGKLLSFPLSFQLIIIS